MIFNKNKKIIIFKIFFLLCFIIIKKTNINNNKFIKYEKNYFSLTPIYLFNSKNYKNNTLYFNLVDKKYYYSLKFKLIKIIYKIGFFDKNKNLILPSDLTLYNNLHIICHIIIINKNIEINSIPNIYLNNYYECIEFLNINEKFKLGIKIYENDKEKIEEFYFFLSNTSLKNKNFIFIKDEKFEFIYFIKEYISLKNQINNININKTLKLKKSYITYPLYSLKRNAVILENVWYFKNIFNEYCCFCKGLICPPINNFQR